MKFTIMLSVLFLLAACGQGVDNSSSSGAGGEAETATAASEGENNGKNSGTGTNTGETTAEQEDVKVEVTAPDQDTFAAKLHEFLQSAIPPEHSGDRYIDREGGERDGHFVIQVTGEEELNEVADKVDSYFEGGKGRKFTLYVEQITYPLTYLREAQEEIRARSDEFRTGERPVFGLGVSVQENLLYIDVSSIDDLDMEALEEHFGTLDFIKINEGEMAEMTENEAGIQIPASEPYTVGEINEIDSEKNIILVNNLIYASVNSAIITDQSGEIPFEELHEGDQVRLWTDGIINDSEPAQGMAVFVEVIQ